MRRRVVASSRHGDSRCLVAVTSAFGLLLGLLSALVTTGPARADSIPDKPLTDPSFYMTTTSQQVAFGLGCDQAHEDAPGWDDSEVVLDFGMQLSNGSGTKAIGGPSALTFSNSQIKTDVEAFANGYFSCTGDDLGSNLMLAVGTNNSGGNTTAAAGTAWGILVVSIATYLYTNGVGQVHIEGADDMEVGFGSATGTVTWSNAYLEVTRAADSDLTDLFSSYVDTGSADGCPETTHTGGACAEQHGYGWTQYTFDQLINVGGGHQDAYPVPEIYYPAQAKQWAQIAWYVAAQDGYSALPFYDGPLDTHPTGASSNTAQQAWAQLNQQLDATPASMNMPYSEEQHWEPQS